MKEKGNQPDGEIMLDGWLVLFSFNKSLSINLSASSMLMAWPWCCTLVGRPMLFICCKGKPNKLD